MSANVSLGDEDRPLTERLPAGYFTALSTKIGQIARLAYGQTIDMIAPPAILRTGALRAADLAMELTVELRNNATTDDTEATNYTMLIAEVEPYEPLEAAELWSWRQLTLDLRRRRKDYSHGTSIVLENAEIQLTDAPAIGQRRRTVPARLQGMEQLAAQCTADDVVWFLDKLGTIEHHLQGLNK